MTKTKPQKSVRGKKTVRMYALVDEKNYLPSRFDHAHNVFAPRVYDTKSGAQSVADVVVTGGAKLRVVPCTITYQVPKKGV